MKDIKFGKTTTLARGPIDDLNVFGINKMIHVLKTLKFPSPSNSLTHLNEPNTNA